MMNASTKHGRAVVTRWETAFPAGEFLVPPREREREREREKERERETEISNRWLEVRWPISGRVEAVPTNEGLVGIGQPVISSGRFFFLLISFLFISVCVCVCVCVCSFFGWRKRGRKKENGWTALPAVSAVSPSLSFHAALPHRHYLSSSLSPSPGVIIWAPVSLSRRSGRLGPNADVDFRHRRGGPTAFAALLLSFPRDFSGNVTSVIPSPGKWPSMTV